MTSGIYILVFKLERDGCYTIGKLGNIDFPAGYYCYVGSALNGLEARIDRHLRKEKKFHWHIDYLLQYARITEIIYAKINKSAHAKLTHRAECMIAKSLAGSLSCIKGFGCSDCRCPSHLFHSEKANIPGDKAADAVMKLN